MQCSLKQCSRLAGYGGACINVCPALWRLREENLEFKVSLHYILILLSQKAGKNT